MERDVDKNSLVTLTKISTHTLTWSVTSPFYQTAYQIPISTHTLTWSVTNPPTLETKGYKNFNSHAHVERDARAFINPMFNGISTHTLTWSVTENNNRFLPFIYISIILYNKT